MIRVAVVGHVEWLEFAVVGHVPQPGEIVESREDFTMAAGGGAVAAVQLRKLACAADDKIEHRLWITWRGRHRLEHIDGGGLVLDPFVELRVAVSQFSDPRREFLGLRSLTC